MTNRLISKVSCSLIATTLLSAIVTATPQRIAAQKEFDFVASGIRDLGNKDPRVRVQAAQLIGNRASPGSAPEDREKARAAAPALVEALADPDHSVRDAAAFALGNVPGDPKLVVPALIVTLRDKAIDVRQHAARALGLIAKEPALAVPALLSSFKTDADTSVRAEATDALIAFGPAAAPALPDLIPMLSQPGYDPAVSAAKIIAAIGPPAEAAEPSLVELVKKAKNSEDAGDIGKALEAAYALGEMGKDQPLAVSVLTSLLKAEDRDDRARAAGVLGEIGLPSEPAIPALVKALADRDSDVRWIAATAISRIAVALRDAHRTGAIDPLQKAVAAMDASPDQRVKGKVRICESAVNALQEDRRNGLTHLDGYTDGIPSPQSSKR